MEEKQYLEFGFCPQTHYNCMMPIRYTRNGEKEPFVKQDMCCTLVRHGACTKQAECKIIETAPDQVDADHEYLLSDLRTD